MSEHQRIFEEFPGKPHVWALIYLLGLIASVVSFSLMSKYDYMLYPMVYFGVASRLALLPVVAALPAPSWARLGGYILIVEEIILFIAKLHGLDDVVANPIRYGAHFLVALWPFGVALRHTGFVRYGGYVLASAFAIFPLLGTLIPPEVGAISLPIILFWMIAVVRELKRKGL